MLIIKGRSNTVIEPDEKTLEYEKENEDIPLAKQRYDICLECPELTKLRFCSQCGCFMPLKVRIDKVECPLKKW